MRSLATSEPAVWEKCIKPPIPGSGAASQSNCCLRHSRTIPNGPLDLNVKRVLASLNHSNIATIYGVEETNGHYFLVMELVSDETLAERIARGAIPLDEVLWKQRLTIAKEIPTLVVALPYIFRLLQ